MAENIKFLLLQIDPSLKEWLDNKGYAKLKNVSGLRNITLKEAVGILYELRFANVIPNLVKAVDQWSKEMTAALPERKLEVYR